MPHLTRLSLNDPFTLNVHRRAERMHLLWKVGKVCGVQGQVESLDRGQVLPPKKGKAPELKPFLGVTQVRSVRGRGDFES